MQVAYIVVVMNGKSDICPSCTHLYQFGLQTGRDECKVDYQLLKPLEVTAAKKINGMMGLVCTRPIATQYLYWMKAECLAVSGY